LGGIAIAIGVMVDASVVLVENAHKHLERSQEHKRHTEIILEAAKEVGPALFYSLLIITVSFLPVLSLQEQSGRLFKPLAYTYTFAIAASSLVAITIVSGAFVAGTDAGLIFNTFPLMEGRLVPDGYLPPPWYVSPFEDIATIQFHHRVLAIVSLVLNGVIGAIERYSLRWQSQAGGTTQVGSL